ncbi:unnamed protein product [Durusdinium trenchii]|uniref:RAP domain-containing protein n=2 Tax=Durusdinium trenchii TaxID=1381693 RepID=A0ABP0JBB9_9DINO
MSILRRLPWRSGPGSLQQVLVRPWRPCPRRAGGLALPPSATSGRGAIGQDWQEQKDLARRLRRLDSKELYEVVHGRLDSFDFVSLLMAFQRLSKLGLRTTQEEQLARELMQRLERLLNSNVARERNRARRFPWLSQAAWAAAKVLPQLPEESRSFLAQVSQASAAALRVSKPFDARDAANLLWSLATAKLVPPPRVLEAAGRLPREDFGAQDLANLIWALARLECTGPFLEELCDMCQQRIHALEPKGLAAVLSALAALARSDRGAMAPQSVASLLRAAARRLEQDLAQESWSWRPPELVQVFWAFSSLQLDEVDYQHLPLKPQLTGVDLRSAVGPGKIFSRRWGALAPRDLSLLAWSFANSNSELLASEVPLIAQVALPQLSDFDHQGISNLVWALGTVSIADRELFSRVGQLVTTGDYSARQVANICWAYATVSLLHTEFIEKAKALATRSFDAFRADEQVSLLWSFAVLGVQWDELQVPALPRLSAREAGNLCWSLAVLGHHHQEVLTGCAQMLEASFGSNLEVHMTQWHMAALAFKLETGLPLQLEGLQHFAARAAAVAQHRAVQQQGTSSKLHGEVSREVRRRCRSEVMQVGRAEQLQSRRGLVLEVDGPHHFARRLPEGDLVLQGGSQLKQRLLQRLGWQVLRVDWETWRRDPEGAVERLLRRSSGAEKQRTQERTQVLGKGSFGKAYLVKNTEATGRDAPAGGLQKTLVLDAHVVGGLQGGDDRDALPKGCDAIAKRDDHKLDESEDVFLFWRSEEGSSNLYFLDAQKQAENELCVVKQMETSAMEAKESRERKKMDHPNIIRFKEAEPLCRAASGSTFSSYLSSTGFLTAASFGRSEALKDRPIKKDGREEWLHNWSRSSASAPFATNFHVVEAPPELQWTSGGPTKGSTLTAQRVFNKGGLEELHSETQRVLRSLPSTEGLRAAGAPSGCTDRDIGRMAALNCGLRKF